MATRQDERAERPQKGKPVATNLSLQRIQVNVIGEMNSPVRLEFMANIPFGAGDPGGRCLEGLACQRRQRGASADQLQRLGHTQAVLLRREPGSVQ